MQGHILSVTVFEPGDGTNDWSKHRCYGAELAPPLVTLMVNIGVPLSFLAVPA
jgi:hypothetical protein